MRKVWYRGRYLTVETESFKLRGKKITITREIKPDVAVIIPQLQNGKFIIERQYRHALEKYNYEFPAGHMDPGETAMDCARRELEEETGYRATKLKPLITTYWSPGYSTQRMTFFFASGLVRTRRKLDSTEDIRVIVASMKQIGEMIKNKKMKDAHSIFAYLYLMSHPEVGDSK
jgi:ADP-ribose pyrophosphatase